MTGLHGLAAEVKRFFDQKRQERSTRFFSLPQFKRLNYCLVGVVDACATLVIYGEHTLFKPVKSSSFIQVTLSPDHQLVLKCIDPKQDDLFCIFVADILALLNQAKSDQAGLRLFYGRYEAWQQFWKRPPQRMTLARAQGLFGELIYMNQLLDRGMTPQELVASWRGCENAHQDFVFENGWAEVKTIQASATQIEMSSLHQLYQNACAAHFGHLVVVCLRKDPVSEHCYLLSELIEKTKARLCIDPQALLIFEGALRLMGAPNAQGSLDEDVSFEVLSVQTFDTQAPDFPKLTTANVPLGVVKATYCLDRIVLNQWLIAKEEVYVRN